jgi:hypothetical protein
VSRGARRCCVAAVAASLLLGACTASGHSVFTTATGGPPASFVDPRVSPSPVSAEVSATSTPSPAATLRPGRLLPGGSSRPPQFVVLSFDGSGSLSFWQHWREMGNRYNARFTFLLSGVYLLGREHRMAYHPPKHSVGYSAIGFANPKAGMPVPAYLTALAEQMRLAIAEGSEIGSHFNGHFCSGNPGGVGTWTEADWNQEIDQFNSLIAHVNSNNALNPPVTLPFTGKDVVGTRTPCLEGKFPLAYAALKAHGYRYDSSQNVTEGGWPTKQQGIWSIPLHNILRVGTTRHTLSSDYTFYFNQSHGAAAPAPAAAGFEKQAYLSFRKYFDDAYFGDRAPISIGMHFERWNNLAYTNAAGQLVASVCSLPEVRCVPYRDVADWLDRQSPTRLAAYAKGAFPKLSAATFARLEGVVGAPPTVPEPAP